MDLKTKLTDMIELVRSNPDNQEHRLALIQYLCLSDKSGNTKNCFPILKSL